MGDIQNKANPLHSTSDSWGHSTWKNSRHFVKSLLFFFFFVRLSTRDSDDVANYFLTILNYGDSFQFTIYIVTFKKIVSHKRDRCQLE